MPILKEFLFNFTEIANDVENIAWYERILNSNFVNNFPEIFLKFNNKIIEILKKRADNKYDSVFLMALINLPSNGVALEEDEE